MESWLFPLHCRVVPRAAPDNIVRGDPRLLVDQLIAAGRELVAMAVDGITTTFGFPKQLHDYIKEVFGCPLAYKKIIQFGPFEWARATRFVRSTTNPAVQILAFANLHASLRDRLIFGDAN